MSLKDEIGILYVDDEELSLKYFKKHFLKLGPIFVAPNAAKGLEIFEKEHHKIGIVLSDKLMPRVDGFEFLERVRAIDDMPLRMLVTIHSNLPEAVKALNDGLIYTYLTKPWEPDDLKNRLLQAKDRFWISREKRAVLKNREMAFQKMLMAEQVSDLETLGVGLNYHMRNALNGIQGFFDMIPHQLEKEVGVPKDSFFWHEYYQTIDRKINQVISLLDGIAEGSMDQHAEETRLEQDQFDVIEISKEIGSAETSKEPHLKFIYEGPDEVEIKGDEKKVMRLLSGLTQEAKQRMGSKKGTIQVRAQVINNELGGSSLVCLKYIDDGAILNEKDRKKLFDPFTVGGDSPKDSGLSLLSCYYITYSHGGTIKAGCEDGKNVITLILPI